MRAMIGEATPILTPGRRLAAARPLRPLALAGTALALLVLAIAPATQRTVPAGASATGLSALPLAARPLVSSTLGRDQASYRIRESGSVLAAHNAAQGLSARFAADGVQVRSGGDAFSLRLRAAGYGSSLQPLAVARPAAQANRVSYRRGSLTEWYTNGPLGLEQGFTLRAPPAGARTGSLTLALSLTGSLRPALERGRTSLTFADSSLRYTGLAAFDARGRKLPARLELRGHALLIRVGDRGARYPLTIDPWVQQAKLTGGSDISGCDLSTDSIWPVAISGDTIVAGAPAIKIGHHQTCQGSLFVFVKPASGWANANQTATLTASDGRAYDRLGYSVAIQGDTIVAASGWRQAAYVFVKPAGGWTNATESARLTASDGNSLGRVGISGDTIVAGGSAAYVFLKPATGWASGTETAKLTASDGSAIADVAISGDTIVASAPGPTYVETDPNFVYVFVKPAAGGWANDTETARLRASDGVSTDDFGQSVAISGGTVVASAPFADVSGQVDQGAVYVFAKPLGGWTNATETAKLTASDGAADRELGRTVAVSGKTIVAGGLVAIGYRGASYVFDKPVGGWTNGTETVKLTSSDGVDSNWDGYGRYVAIAGDRIVVGAPLHTVGNPPRGENDTYVYWRAPAAIKVTKQVFPASDTGRFDLKVAGTVVKAAAGKGDFGELGVAPGTYRVSESASAGTRLSDYSTSIACTINGNSGPAADGTTHLDVTIAAGDTDACTITNRRKAQVTLIKHLVPSTDPGRFDLKIAGTKWDRAGTVVKAGAGEGDSGGMQVAAGGYVLSELASPGTNLSDYTSSIACTRNGNPGPSASKTSISLQVAPGDVLACTFTNQQKTTITLTKALVPTSDPGRFDLKVGQTVVVAGAGNGGSGSLPVSPGTYRLHESPAEGTSLSTYATSIACTLNGNPGPSANGTTQLDVSVSARDQLACTLTNRRK
jgi:FG-GAP repeat/Prealbumin-like fold domain